MPIIYEKRITDDVRNNIDYKLKLNVEINENTPLHEIENLTQKILGPNYRESSYTEIRDFTSKITRRCYADIKDFKYDDGSRRSIHKLHKDVKNEARKYCRDKRNEQLNTLFKNERFITCISTFSGSRKLDAFFPVDLDADTFENVFEPYCTNFYEHSDLKTVFDKNVYISRCKKSLSSKFENSIEIELKHEDIDSSEEIIDTLMKSKSIRNNIRNLNLNCQGHESEIVSNLVKQFKNSEAHKILLTQCKNDVINSLSPSGFKKIIIEKPVSPITLKHILKENTKTNIGNITVRGQDDLAEVLGFGDPQTPTYIDLTNVFVTNWKNFPKHSTLHNISTKTFKEIPSHSLEHVIENIMKPDSHKMYPQKLIETLRVISSDERYPLLSCLKKVSRNARPWSRRDTTLCDHEYERLNDIWKEKIVSLKNDSISTERKNEILNDLRENGIVSDLNIIDFVLPNTSGDIKTQLQEISKDLSNIQSPIFEDSDLLILL